MKRLLLITVISLLFVSGWSRVLASAFCPDMQGSDACAMRQSKAPDHSAHQAMEMSDMSMPEAAETTTGALESPLPSCCVTPRESPPAPVIASKGAEQSKQEPSAAPKPASKAMVALVPSFAPPITSRQHAPPGSSTSRHVIISVFLI